MELYVVQNSNTDAFCDKLDTHVKNVFMNVVLLLYFLHFYMTSFVFMAFVLWNWCVSFYS